MAANGYLETPSATVELQFEVGVILFKESFLVMNSLTRPLLGLLFLQRNSTLLDMHQRVLNFPFFSMHLKHADNTYSNNKEPVLNPRDILIQASKQTVIYIKSQVYVENEVTGMIQPSAHYEDNDEPSICPALTTTQNRQFTLLINNFLENPYTLKKGCHIAKFSILTPK